MADLTAKRTLVKSPPELWEELSEVERLAKHLDAFGEITITKLEPEHTVAWEGEHASGTVSIEASGWGTKVTLTAELPERPELLEPEPAEAAAGDEATIPPPVDPPVCVQSDLEEPVAEPPDAEDPVGMEPVSEEPGLRNLMAEEPAPLETRRGFWSRLLGRSRPRRPEAVEPQDAQPAEPADVSEHPDVEAHPIPPLATELQPPDPEPDSPSLLGPVTPAGATRQTTPEPDASPEPSGIPEDEVRAVLAEVLDTLGAAHHRPFSRR